MFWQSVSAGILAIFDWHIIVGAIGVSLICLVIVPLTTGLIAGGGDSSGREKAGCIFILIGGPILQAAAVSGFILFCLPAIAGNGGFTPLGLIGPMLWQVFKIGLLAMLVVIFLSIIPVVGAVITKTPGVPIFLQGVLMLKPILKTLYSASEGNKLPDSVFPSFWHCLGFVLIGIAVCWVALSIIAAIGNEIRKKRHPIEHMIDQYRNVPSTGELIVGTVFGGFFGIVPLLMYGQFVQLSLADQGSRDLPESIGELAGLSEFKASIELRNQAFQILNASKGDSPTWTTSTEDAELAMGLLRKSLEKTKKVSDESLAILHPDLPEHYRSEFAKGVELFLKASDSIEARGGAATPEEIGRAMLGQGLMDRFGEWYTEAFKE